MYVLEIEYRQHRQLPVDRNYWHEKDNAKKFASEHYHRRTARTEKTKKIDIKWSRVAMGVTASEEFDWVQYKIKKIYVED